MKHTLELLIRILLHGGHVEYDGFKYAMSEDGDLCIVKEDNANEGLIVDFTLKDIYKLAEGIGRDELWLKCCKLELARLRR